MEDKDTYNLRLLILVKFKGLINLTNAGSLQLRNEVIEINLIVFNQQSHANFMVEKPEKNHILESVSRLTTPLHWPFLSIKTFSHFHIHLH